MRGLSIFSILAIAAGSSIGESWITSLFSGLSANPQEAKLQGLQKVQDLIKNYQLENPGGVASEYPYFNMLPQYRAGVVAGAPASTWSARCFKSTSATSVSRSTGSVTVTITAADPSSAGCVDDYNIMTITGVQKMAITEAGTFDFIWALPADYRSAEKWDLDTKGVRVFEYMTDEKTSIANALETVLLFIPEATKTVDPISAQRNVDFMAKYPQFQMESRDPLSTVPPMEHQVKSGDFFGVIRLDGLDPMLAWAMGSTTGHTTVALWMDGELYVTESTVTDSYWPTNGIQKTPYRQWLKQAEEASYNVVWAPLNKETRLKYNESAAVEFFKANEGLDYGYRNMLYGWIDTLYNNYPCVPGDYSTVCTQWEYFEAIFGVLDRAQPALVDLFVNQAFNLRLGTSGLRLAEILQEAGNRGMQSREIPTLVEQDSFMYQTTRNGEPAVGRSMVCCVYVCASWKAAGVFGDKEINCGEQTNADDYGMALFQEEQTQILGRWTLKLNHFNIKKPFAHMGETCSSLAPDYEQAVDC